MSDVTMNREELREYINNLPDGVLVTVMLPEEDPLTEPIPKPDEEYSEARKIMNELMGGENDV